MLKGLGSDLEEMQIFFYTIEDFNSLKFGMKPRSVESFHGMMLLFWGSLLALPPHV